jgi:hypothetical protein
MLGRQVLSETAQILQVVEFGLAGDVQLLLWRLCHDCQHLQHRTVLGLCVMAVGMKRS